MSLGKGGGSWRCGGGQRSGRVRLSADQIVEDVSPGVAAAREQHLLSIRTPRTTSSEITVALRSSRMFNTV
jgi:hypothetical protein